MHVCELLENLLKGCLTDRILADTVSIFDALDKAKQETDRLGTLRDSILEVVIVVFENVNLLEDLSNFFDECQAVLFDVEPVDEADG